METKISYARYFPYDRVNVTKGPWNGHKGMVTQVGFLDGNVIYLVKLDDVLGDPVIVLQDDMKIPRSTQTQRKAIHEVSARINDFLEELVREGYILRGFNSIQGDAVKITEVIWV